MKLVDGESSCTETRAVQDLGFKASVVSTMALAGGIESGFLESLPKGWLVALAGALILAVGFFAKRDYTSFTTRLAALEKAQQDNVSQPTFSAALSAGNKTLHGKINGLGKRVTIVESLLGMHGKVDVEVLLARQADEDNDGGDESAG